MTGEERVLRERLVERARDLGDVLDPADLRLAYAGVPGSQDDRLVAASWGAGATENALSGLLRVGEEPDLNPGHAMESLFVTWSGQGSDRPEAGAMAQALGHLLDPLARWKVLTTVDDDTWPTAPVRPSAPSVGVGSDPERITCLTFWWSRGAVAREVVLDIDNEGRVAMGGGRTAPDHRPGDVP